ASQYNYVYTNILAGTYTFYAVATDVNGVSTTSSSITVTVPSAAPSITTQPVGATVTAPATARFSVAASGTPAPTYQWQQEASGASTYTAISGATSASYITPATTTSNSGTKYECFVTNTAGSVTSNAAILTVNPTGHQPAEQLFPRHCRS
ncbi:MAG: immunoglobulin domain-containing protein, partial [Candidatus Omnitrophica bacterium]|nr:immunoglobulin domain-containing protein [Candidatus Omnitrophota bacterium]